MATTVGSTYLTADQASELERLRLQSRVWEPVGERLLAQVGPGDGYQALEIGCGAMGWLRLLSRWVGDAGRVTGTDVDERMLAAAADLRDEERLPNVTLARDDVFASALPPASFDLVHLRFQLAPLGRAPEQLAAARRLVRPGGWLVLEEAETGSWREYPAAPSVDHLRALIADSFVRAECLALEPDHPYLQLPFSSLPRCDRASWPSSRRASSIAWWLRRGQSWPRQGAGALRLP